MANGGKQKGLGRGLEALFADAPSREFTAEERNAEGVDMLGIDSIKPNAAQPRKKFDKESMEDLTASIKEHGIIQPIIVRPAGDGYEIVAGERRYRAARAAGLKEVPALIRELSDRDNMLIAIIENMQREDLDPIEEAEGLESMIKGYGLTQEQVSQSVGKSRPYITNSLRLLKLSDEIKKMISSGGISAAHGRTLLGCKDEKKRLQLAKKTAEEDLSVRALEDMVRGKTAKRKKPLARKKDANLVAVEDNLKKSLGTKVSVVRRGKRGKIEIEYYSEEELERLIELLESVSE